jgi:hypothetical protein
MECSAADSNGTDEWDDDDDDDDDGPNGFVSSLAKEQSGSTSASNLSLPPVHSNSSSSFPEWCHPFLLNFEFWHQNFLSKSKGSEKKQFSVWPQPNDKKIF